MELDPVIVFKCVFWLGVWLADVVAAINFAAYEAHSTPPLNFRPDLHLGGCGTARAILI